MKKIIALLLATIMLLAFAGCEKDPNTTKPIIPQTQPSEPSGSITTVPTEPDDLPTDPSEPTEPTEPVHYDPNLPDDIILSLEGKSASVVNKRAQAVFEEMGLKSVDRAQRDPEDYPNGVPYIVFYKGEDREGWAFATLEEWFDAECENIHLHRATITFNAYGSPDQMSLLGINKNADREEVFSVLGTPDSEIEEGMKGYVKYSYYWNDFYIGETYIDYVAAHFVDGACIEISIYFS